jgi:hypothetical protein
MLDGLKPPPARVANGRSGRKWLLAAALLATGSLLYLWFGDTAVRQERWMRMAREHVPVVEALLAGDATFRGVRVDVGTGGGGTLLVVGSVASAGDLQRLRAVIATSQPPVEAMFVVRIE